MKRREFIALSCVTLRHQRAAVDFAARGADGLGRANSTCCNLQRVITLKTWPRVVHRLHHSCVRACTPFFKMFVCPLAEGLNHCIV